MSGGSSNGPEVPCPAVCELRSCIREARRLEESWEFGWKEALVAEDLCPPRWGRSLLRHLVVLAGLFTLEEAVALLRQSRDFRCSLVGHQFSCVRYVLEEDVVGLIRR